MTSSSSNNSIAPETPAHMHFAVAYQATCAKLLSHLARVLSREEVSYLLEHGPRICAQHLIHDSLSSHGGCPEARAAWREALSMEAQTRELLTKSGVTASRQQLLWEVVHGADNGYLDAFPPRSMSHVVHFLNNKNKNGTLVALRDLANETDAPEDVIRSLQRFVAIEDTLSSEH